MNKNFSPLSLSNAPDASVPILNSVNKRFGMIPNLMGNFAYNPAALNAYLSLGDIYEQSGLSPLEQQVVAITVSRENGCSYCIAAHTAISAMGKLDSQTIQLLRDGKKLNDIKLESLRRFTKRVVSAKGLIDDSDLDDFLNAGYAKEHVLAVLIGVSLKILANYTNHIAKTDLDEGFKTFVWLPN